MLFTKERIEKNRLRLLEERIKIEAPIRADERQKVCERLRKEFTERRDQSHPFCLLFATVLDVLDKEERDDRDSNP